MRKLLQTVQSAFSLAKWRSFLTRGDRFFILNKALYIHSSIGTRYFTSDFQQRTTAPGRHGRLFVHATRLGRLSSRPNLGVTSVEISGLGRFGNSVQQLLNAVSFAQSFGAPSVFFHRSPILPPTGLELQGPIKLLPHLINGDSGRNPPHYIWRSDFFEAGTQSRVVPPQAVLALRPALSSWLSTLDNGAQNDPSCLTVHLRSGDIYGPQPHPDYGQAPLSFYGLVLESHHWKNLRIVTEDNKSPVLGGLIDLSRKLGIPTTVVGETLADAQQEIVRSSTLIASRGTFIPALLFLFPKPRTVFSFGADFEPLVPDTALTIVNFVDWHGTYTSLIQRSNWKNSPEQRAAMLSYSAQFLRQSPAVPDGTPPSGAPTLG